MPTSRVLTTLYKKTLSNKGVTDLSIVKYYNYNKFSYYATSYMLRVHEQGLGVAVELPLFRRYKAKERRRLLRSVRNYKLYTVGLPYAR
jgi:hypothetical protein